MGGEQTIPVSSSSSAVRPGRPPGTGPTQSHTRTTPDHELLIVVRGSRRTGKTTLITRMSGFAFDQTYQATRTLESTEIMWTSPKNERVNVTCWDVVEKALPPTRESHSNVERADAQTVETLKRADGMVLMIDSHFPETVELAEELIVAAPDDLPILVFSNFMDLDGMSPVVPEPLHRFMGRFYYVPGSLKADQGLFEILQWLTVPLLLSKKKMYYNLYKALESDLMQANIDFTVSAQNFVTLEEAVLHMPKFVPIRQEPVRRQSVDPSVDDIIPEPEVDPHAEGKAIEEAPSRERVDQAPAKKSFEKPYRRRQQNATSRPTVLAAANRPIVKPKEIEETPLDSANDQDKEGSVEQSATRRRRRRASGKKENQQEPEVEAQRPPPTPVDPAPPIATPKPLEVPVDAEENDDQGFWSDDEEPKLPESVQAAAATLNMEEDEPEHAPNPLVQKASKAVDLQASIKHQQDKQAEEKSRLNRVSEAVSAPMRFETNADETDTNDDEEQPPDSTDGYGELTGDDTSTSGRPKKVFRKRQTFRGRRSKE